MTVGGYGQAEVCLSGGGEMGAAIRAVNWAATPLGPVVNWPQSLRTSVGIGLDSSFAILIWWGPDLLMLYNDAYRQILGAKHPSALGSAGRDVWPEIWDTIGPLLQGVLETGTATRSDDLSLLLQRNGYPEECYFTFSYSPIRDESGGVGGVFTPVAETTEKVIGERRLRTLRDLASRGAGARSAEAALKLAAGTLALNPHDIPFALIYRLDEPGVAHLAAAAGIQAGGPASPERIDLGGECAWPVAQVAQTGEACEVGALAERFGPLPCGAWNVPPASALVLPVSASGRDAPLAVLIAAVSPRKALDEHYRTFYGLVAGLVAGRVTAALSEALAYEQERKRAEEALRASQQRAQRQLLELENLYNTTPVGLCIVDTNLRFLRINQQLADMHGLAPEAHLGLTLREVAPSLAPVIEPLYERVLASGEPLRQVEVEAVLPDPHGKRIWLVSIVPLVVDGDLVGINKVVQDITSRKQFEEQLRQTQKLEAIGILAGGVAHDFNNLLTGILGNASLAAEMLPAKSPAQPMLEELITASERAADLTRQLLAYSGKGRYLIEPVDLSRVVEEISMLVRTSIPRNVDLRLDLRRDLPSLEGDAVQIQQLVMNLVINAAEAVDAGRHGYVALRTGVCGPETRVRDTVSAETLPAGQYVYVQVEDNGHGMDEATRTRIFDPFFTTKFTGRGLGLAAALGIVRGHRGAIHLTTQPGEGTTFLVFFPAAQTAVPGRVPAAEAVFGSLAGSGVILVVDDEEVVRAAARSALERYGYRVLTAENGARAVELFRECAGRVDAVLLDVSMPVMDGVETLRRLRAIRPRVPVVVTSGFDEREAMRRFRGDAVDAFLQKPYRAARVAQVIRDVLAPRLTRTSAPE